MICSKKELKFYIMADRIMRGYSPSLTLIERVKNLFLPDNILLYLKCLRCASYYSHTNKLLGLWYHYKFQKLGLKLGFSIGKDVFGYGLVIPHYGTIVVNGGVRAGNYCVLHTSTCIGGGKKMIGSELYLSTGSIILKDITLGDNITIAANSLVNKSCEEGNCLLAGSPAKKIKESVGWIESESGIYEKRKYLVEKIKAEMNL